MRNGAASAAPFFVVCGWNGLGAVPSTDIRNQNSHNQIWLKINKNMQFCGMIVLIIQKPAIKAVLNGADHMSILEELWYGNIRPCEMPLKVNGDYLILFYH